MDFRDVILRRYSVRSYRRDPVEDGKLERVLEAARLAPTAVNYQAFRIIVIRTAGREEELGRIYSRDWLVRAPIVICLCGIPGLNWVRRDGKNFNDVDTAIVMDHLILAATAEGLGTCWIGAFDPKAAREVLGIPDDAVPVVLTPLGYADDSPGQKKRKPLQELVRYDHW